MRYLLLFLLSTFALAPVAQAAKSELQMNGIASYTELRSPYYIGALYLDQPVVSAGQVLSSWGQRRMEMRITAQRWTPRRFSSQWTQALILNVDPARLEKYDDAFVQFNNLPRGTLRYGDHIVVESDAKGRTRVSVNGTEMFKEPKPGFFEVLLATWIGEKPPSSEFKQAVLGNIDPELLREYEVLQPAPQRKAEVAAWLEGGTVEQPETEAVTQEPQLAAAEQPEPVAKQKEQKAVVAATAAASVVAASAAAAPAAAASTASKSAGSSASAASASKDVASISESVAVTDAVPEPKVVEPVNKPAAKTQRVVAMAPTASRAVVEPQEPAMDPEIYRLQQETLLKLYRSSIIKRALRQVKYPKSAVRRGQQGVVGLELTVDRSGNIVALEQASASRFKSLNSAAVAAVHDAGTLPPVPASLDGEQIVVSIPVKFTLQ